MTSFFAFNLMSRMKRLHFVGIGGAGMGGIAEVLFHQGFQVTGSDLTRNAMTHRLTNLGIKIYHSHEASHIHQVDAVIQSAAIDPNNPEIQAAQKARLPIVARAMMLGELMRFRCGIAVAGTHGKTTTTSLIATIFAEAGVDPTFVIGGRLNSANTHARLGKGQYLIAEADESDASFLHLHPMLTVVTNIDTDHMETYQGNFSYLKKTFVDFLHQLPFYGRAVLCYDDEAIREILPNVSRPVLTYGLSDQADVYASEITQTGTKNYFCVNRPFLPALPITLNLAGEHNVLNALAAISVATEMGIPDDAILTALANFAGVDRRMQIHGEYQTDQGQILLIDDYGHHPREITVTLQAIRSAFPDRRLVMVYQPHRYTRTRHLMAAFVHALSQVDQLFLLETYSAGEKILTQSDSLALATQIRHNSKIDPVFVPEKEKLGDYLKQHLQNNDILLMQGAGDIGVIATRFAHQRLLL